MYLPFGQRPLALCLLLALSGSVSTNSAQAEAAAAGVPAKAPTLFLNGRLEQISGRAAQMPIEKTIKGLKIGIAKVDGSVAVAKQQTKPYSYPQKFNGNWGGRLAITYANYDADVPVDRHQLSVGDQGLGIFSFVTESGKMLLEPSKLWFKPQVARKIKNFAVPKNMLSEAKDPEAKVNTALLDLGGISSVDANGQQVEYSVLKNTLTNLGKNVLEQNIVLRSNRVNAKTGAVRNDYTETVVRITPVRPDLMYSQIGYVQYGPSGVPLAQFICQGWITRNWLAAAKGIEQMSGLPLSDLGYNSDISAEAAAASLPSARDFVKGKTSR